MKIIGKTNSVISREERSIEPSIFLQREAKRCYFVKLYKISTKQCVPIGNFVPKSPKCHFFRKNREIGKNHKIFQMFSFCLYKSIYFTRIWKLKSFPDFSRFPDFSQKNDILLDFGTKFPIGTHCLELMLYKVTK